MAPERKISVATDFDGVVTNTWKEADTYLSAYTDALAKRIGITPIELTGHLNRGKELILAKAGMFGWEYNGLIVAPAEADPYLLNQAASRIILEELKRDSRKLAIPSPADMDNFFNELHHEIYPKAGIFFQDGAKEYIEQLHASGKFTIVTNAKTNAVKRKLEVLLGEKAKEINVVGDARKYEVDQTWVEFPEYTELFGLPRKVYLRRKTYHDALKKIGADVVVGDIYELDLALPETEGKHTILVLSTHTPQWESDHYNFHPHGSKVSSLSQVVDIIPNLR